MITMAKTVTVEHKKRFIVPWYRKAKNEILMERIFFACTDAKVMS